MNKYEKGLKNFMIRYLISIVGIFLIAISYNLFYVPNNFVTGGVTGLALIFQGVLNIPANLFILSGNIFFIVLSIAVLGFRKSIVHILGAITFTISVYFTAGIDQVITFNFSNEIFDIICAGVVTGTGAGILYKMNFSSGGVDVLVNILAAKYKKAIGRTGMYINSVIMALGTFVFGIEMLISVLIIKFLESYITDKILLGISDSKMFLINTEKDDEVKEYLMLKISSGVTMIKTKGAFLRKNKEMILCVVPTEKYIKVRENIREIDPQAFIVISDCYEVLNGTKKQKLPLNKLSK